jgi:hypothetical protein
VPGPESVDVHVFLTQWRSMFCVDSLQRLAEGFSLDSNRFYLGPTDSMCIGARACVHGLRNRICAFGAFLGAHQILLKGNHGNALLCVFFATTLLNHSLDCFF